MDRNHKALLSFYTDSQDNKAIWLDGLKMLKGITDKRELSAETFAQIQSLVEIRKSTQLLALGDSQFGQVVMDSDEDDDDDEDDYYDLVELATVLSGFHFL